MKKVIWLLLTITVVALVIWVQGKPLFENGIYDPNRGLIFKDYVIFRDSLVHLSLVNEISERFPPTNFSAGGVPLKNYHYLFDAGIALVLKFVPITLLEFYFRVLPVLLSTLLCVVIFLTTLKFTKNRFFASLSIFFAVFATSFGALVPHIKIALSARSVTGGNNMFMTDQIFTMMLNPQGVLSLIIFLTLFLLLDRYIRLKKLFPLVCYALLLGLSFGIKAYGGIIFGIAGILFSLYYLVLKRDFRPLLATIVGLIIIGFWFTLTIDSKVAGISFAPFWLLDVMYNDLDRLNEPALPFLKSTYIFLGSWHHVARLTLEQFATYFVGSLGLRLLGFIGLFYLLKNIKKVTPAVVFLFAASAASFSIPLLFNQSSKAYDIIQFSTYFTLFMGICFTLALYAISQKIKNNWIMAGVIALFILAFLGLASRDLEERFKPNTAEIVFSDTEVEAIDYIKTSTPKDSLFLLYVSPSGGVPNFNDDYLWLPGLTGRRTFYSGERFAAQVGIDVNAKKDAINNFEVGSSCPLEFDYIYTKRSDYGKFDRIKTACNAEIVFENNDIIILRHNN